MTFDTAKTADGSLRRGWSDFARYYLGNRWVLLALGGLVLIIGGALNWGWLVAAGIAPVLVAVAPCAIMCALGLCGMKMMSGSNAAQDSPAPRSQFTDRPSAHMMAQGDRKSTRLKSSHANISYAVFCLK